MVPKTPYLCTFITFWMNKPVWGQKEEGKRQICPRPKKEETRRTCLSPGMVPIRSPLARVHVMLGRGTPRAWQMISVPAVNMIIFYSRQFSLGSFSRKYVANFNLWLFGLWQLCSQLISVLQLSLSGLNSARLLKYCMFCHCHCLRQVELTQTPSI